MADDPKPEDLEPDENGIVSLDAEDAEVEDTPDGGAIVRIPNDEDDSAEDDAEFYTNLAETMPPNELQQLGQKYLELISYDKKSRELRDKQYEEGIKRTGLGKEAPGGAQFHGASKVVHPVLTEVCVDFCARTSKELLPPSGPVKTQIIPVMNKARLEKAKRKADFMNWQLMTDCPEFRSEVEQLLTQLPLGGGQYLKTRWDRKAGRPVFEFIAIDDMLLPYAATNFYTAGRRTHVQRLTQEEVDARIRSGMYVKDNLPSVSGMTPEDTLSGKATNKIEGRDDASFNQDGVRILYECETNLELTQDKQADGAAPYIMTIDSISGQVIGLYRNWAEDDDTQQPLVHTVEFAFIPWRGAYPIGMGQMIGSLSGAATGALRALLDSAFIQNSQSMVKLKGVTSGGQSVEIQPTQVAEIEGGVNVDDIRKLAMPLPYNPPSSTLYQLLGFVVEEARNVVRTTFDDMASGQNTPVGTTLANIEQGMVVFSSIFGRLHAAMDRVYQVVARLNGLYLDDAKTKRKVGETLATRADFTGPADVQPVSDPNVFTEAQRFAQVQVVAQRAGLRPDLYDARKVEELILSSLKMPDAKGLLQPSQTPEEQNAVAENTKAALGRPVLAYPDQDHAAHLKAHVSFLMSPIYGMQSPLFGPQMVSVMVQHLKEHIAFWYAQEVFDSASDVMHGEDLQKLMEQTQDKKDKQALDRMIAEASVNVVKDSTEALQALPPVIQQAMALLQQMTPQVQDPAAQVAMEDVQMRREAAKDKLALEQQKLQMQQQEKAQQQQSTDQREMARLQLEARDKQSGALLEAERIQSTERVAAMGDETQLTIAALGHGAAAVEAERDRAHERMGMVHEAAQADVERMHSAVEGEAQRQHAAGQADLDRAHAASEAEAGRAAAEKAAKAKPKPGKE